MRRRASSCGPRASASGASHPAPFARDDHIPLVQDVGGALTVYRSHGGAPAAAIAYGNAASGRIDLLGLVFCRSPLRLIDGSAPGDGCCRDGSEKKAMAVQAGLQGRRPYRRVPECTAQRLRCASRVRVSARMRCEARRSMMTTERLVTGFLTERTDPTSECLHNCE